MAAADKAQELWDDAERLFDKVGDRNALYDRLDALYDQVETAPKDEDGKTAPANESVKLVRMPYATNTVDLVTDLAAQQELTIEVPAANDSESAEKEADAQEQWLQAWLRQNERAYQRNFTAEFAWLATQRAACVARVLYKDTALKPKGKTLDDGYELAGLPLVLQVRDPRNCAWREGPDGTDLVVERWLRDADEIRRSYPGVLEDEDEYPAGVDVEWTEVWTPTHVCYYVSNEPVPVAGQIVRAHGYGCIPYAIGIARATPRASHRYRPLLSSVETLCRNIDVWYSILATAGWSTVTSAWNIFSASYGGDGGKVLDTRPNATNYFAREDAVQPLQRGTLPPDFFKLGDLMLQSLQQATFPWAMYGQIDSTMAGYAINMLSQSGRRSLAPIWHAIESTYEAVFRIVAIISREKLQPLVGEKIPLRIGQAEQVGRRSTRRDLVFNVSRIGDDWDCRVSLGDPMPQDEAANLRMAIESTGAGLLSKRTALTKFKIAENAEEERERVAVERIVEQLAPIEAVKLAQQRGYVPRKLKLPDGWVMTPDGKVMPDLGTQQPGQEQPPEQGVPNMGTQPGAEGGQLPPELLAALAQQQQGGEATAPETMPPDEMLGPEAGIDPAMLQALSGQAQQMPTMDELAGVPPTPPGAGGF